MFNERPTWQQDAACKGLNPDMFMPRRGDRQAVERAKQICRTCPVIQPCRDYGFELQETYDNHGIWGGLSANQRITIMRMEKTSGEQSHLRQVETRIELGVAR